MTNHAIVWRFRRQVMLEAARLGNVSEACRRAGVSRTTYYRWLGRYLAYGPDGLAPKCGRPPRRRQCLSLQAEQAVLAYALAHPTHGPQRIADELLAERYGALQVSRMSVWRLLRRRGLGSRSRRLAALEGVALAESGLLCEGRRRQAERHIEAQRPGELLCLDSFYVGNLKGVGRIWQLTAIDAFSAVGWAALAVGELPGAVVALLAKRVLPDCAAAGHRVERVLTDHGNEYRSLALNEFLAAHDIGHRYIRVGRPQSNGFVERFQGTILHEFYRIAFRRARYGSLAALQADLDVFVEDYNRHRAHHGYRTKGRRPIELFETHTCNSYAGTGHPRAGGCLRAPRPRAQAAMRGTLDRSPGRARRSSHSSQARERARPREDRISPVQAFRQPSSPATGGRPDRAPAIVLLETRKKAQFAAIFVDLSASHRALRMV